MNNAELQLSLVFIRFRTAALLICGLIFLISINSIHNPFILDDLSKIDGNPDIRSLTQLPAKLIYPYASHQILERNDPSRPVVFTLYSLIYALAGLSPGAYRLVNILIHCACSILILFLSEDLLRKTLKKTSLAFCPKSDRVRLFSFFTALLFASLPVQMGTVIYVYALNDLLFGFFGLLALASFCANLGFEDKARLKISLFFMLLALGSKQSAVTIPLWLIAYDFFTLYQCEWNQLLKNLRIYRWHALLALLYLVWRFSYFGSLGDLESYDKAITGLEYFIQQPFVITKYIFLTLWPSKLALDHYLTPKTISLAQKLFGFIFVLSTFYSLIYFWPFRRNSAYQVGAFALVFFYLYLAPTSSILPTVDLLVERRMYLATWGIALLVALIYDSLGGLNFRKAPKNSLLLLFMFIPASIYSMISVHRNRVFNSPEFTWKEVLKTYPTSPRALNNLGVYYQEVGRLTEARSVLENLASLYSNDPYAVLNLGNLYERIDSPFRDLELAEALFLRSVEIKANFSQAHYNLGRLYQNKGVFQKAEKHYLISLDLDPSHAMCNNNLGLLYYRSGDLSKAKYYLERARQLDAANTIIQQNNLLIENPSSSRSHEISVDSVPAQIVIKAYLDALKADPANKKLKKSLSNFCKSRRIACPNPL